MDSLVTANSVKIRPWELVRISEAAFAFGLSEETIRRRIRRGEVPAWGKKGTLRVRLADIMPQHVPQSTSE